MYSLAGGWQNVLGLFTACHALSVCKLLKQLHGALPVDARVGDAHSVLQIGGVFEILPTRMDIALDHDTDDVLVARLELLDHARCDFGLVLVVLLAVAVATINLQIALADTFFERAIDTGSK